MRLGKTWGNHFVLLCLALVSAAAAFAEDGEFTAARTAENSPLFAQPDYYQGSGSDFLALFPPASELAMPHINGKAAPGQWVMEKGLYSATPMEMDQPAVQYIQKGAGGTILTRSLGKRYSFGSQAVTLELTLSPYPTIANILDLQESLAAVSKIKPEKLAVQLPGAGEAVLVTQSLDNPKFGKIDTFSLLFSAGQVYGIATYTNRPLMVKDGQVSMEKSETSFSDPAAVLKAFAGKALDRISKSPYRQTRCMVPTITVLDKFYKPIDDFIPAQAASARNTLEPSFHQYAFAPDAPGTLTTRSSRGEFSWQVNSGHIRMTIEIFGVSDPEKLLQVRTSAPMNGIPFAPAGFGQEGRMAHRVLVSDKAFNKGQVTFTETALFFRQGPCLVQIKVTQHPSYTGQASSSNAMAPGYTRDMAEKAATLILSRMGASAPQPSAPSKPAETVAWQAEIQARAVGYQDKTLRIPFGTMAARVQISGVVTDDQGLPLAGATVRIAGDDAEMTTGPTGEFAFAWEFMDGTGVDGRDNLKLALDPVPGALSADLVFDQPLVANGKLIRAVLAVKNDGRPYADKAVRIAFEPKWVRGDRPADFLRPSTLRPSLELYATTDAQGRVAITDFPAPGIVRGQMPEVLTEEAIAQVFPLYGIVRVSDRTGADCQVQYAVDSPYPGIQRFSMPPVFSGDWTACRLDIRDPDSQTFRVHIRASGTFRLPGGASLPDELIRTLDGKALDFGYQPPEGLGDDIQAQKDLWAELLKTNCKYAFQLAVDQGGEAIVRQAALMQDTAVAAKKSRVILAQTPDAGITLYTAGKNGVQGIQTVAGSALDIQEWRRENKSGAGSIDEVNTFSNLVGLVGLSPSLQQRIVGSVPKARLLEESLTPILKTKINLPLEVLKLTYENAKTFHAVFKDLAAVANGWEDMFPAKVTVTIEDGEGHQITAMRTVSIRIQRKAN